MYMGYIWIIDYFLSGCTSMCDEQRPIHLSHRHVLSVHLERSANKHPSRGTHRMNFKSSDIFEIYDIFVYIYIYM